VSAAAPCNDRFSRAVQFAFVAIILTQCFVVQLISNRASERVSYFRG